MKRVPSTLPLFTLPDGSAAVESPLHAGATTATILVTGVGRSCSSLLQLPPADLHAFSLPPARLSLVAASAAATNLYWSAIPPTASPTGCSNFDFRVAPTLETAGTSRDFRRSAGSYATVIITTTRAIITAAAHRK